MKLRLGVIGALLLGGCSLVNSPSDFQQGDASTTDAAEADGGTDPILFDGGTDGVGFDVGPDGLTEVGIEDAVVPDVFDAVVPDVFDAGRGERVVQIEAGLNHTCALIDDGQVACWGSNNERQRGHFTDGIDFVDTMLRFESIDVEENISCGVTFDDVAYCWGDVMSSAGGPIHRVGLADALSVKISGYRGDRTALVCLMTRGGVVNCHNSTNLAEPPTTAAELWTGPILPDGDIREFAIGINHITLLMEGGAVHSIGRDGLGQQGDGMRMNGEVLVGPIDVIDAHSNRSCAANANTVSCWGQLGFPRSTGEDAERDAPVTLMTTAGEIHDVDIAAAHGCAAIGMDFVHCWGITMSLDGVPSGAPSPPESFLGEDSRLVATGQQHVCNVVGAAQVRCWGRNTLGQLGRSGANGVHENVLGALLGI